MKNLSKSNIWRFWCGLDASNWSSIIIGNVKFEFVLVIERSVSVIWYISRQNVRADCVEFFRHNNLNYYATSKDLQIFNSWNNKNENIFCIFYKFCHYFSNTTISKINRLSIDRAFWDWDTARLFWIRSWWLWCRWSTWYWVSLTSIWPRPT